MESITSSAFTEFSIEAIHSNKEKIAQAEVVILTNLCFGEQNMANLLAACDAKKLIIIEDLPIEQRDFTQGKATELYKKLVNQRNVTVKTTTDFLDEL